MSQVYCIRRRTKGKHLVERQGLERLITQNIKASKKNKKTQQELAELLGVSPRHDEQRASKRPCRIERWRVA